MIFSKLSKISRRNKLKMFFSEMAPDENSTIIDIGAQVGDRNTDTMQMIDLYPWKKNITAINIHAEHVKNIKEKYPEVSAEVADGLNLPWPDKYFDIAYSNAVIEHVGGPAEQRIFASEISRVSKRFFVTTPNRWYPFEFHLRLPLVTWLPGEGYLKMGSIVSYNHVRRKYLWFPGPVTGLCLLSHRDLRACFPGCRILKSRVTFMPETLIALK